MADEKQKKEKEPFLHLDLSAPEKEPDRETYKVIAEIWLSRWKAAPPQVRITIDGVPWQDWCPLDQQYCCTAHLTGLAPGAHTIVAVTEDGRHRNMKQVNISRPEAKRQYPASLLIHKSGGDGDYVLIFQVLANDDSPVADLVVLAMDPVDPAGAFELPATDKLGVTKLLYHFGEPERTLSFVVPGSKIESKTITLFGPYMAQKEEE